MSEVVDDQNSPMDLYYSIGDLLCPGFSYRPRNPLVGIRIKRNRMFQYELLRAPFVIK